MQRTLIGWAIMSSLIAIMLVGLWAHAMPPLVRAITAPGQRVLLLGGVALPEGHLALIVMPARQAQGGEIALWWAGKDATRVQSLISLGGYPAGTSSAGGGRRP